MLTKTSAYLKEANLIGGKWINADSGATLSVINPATGAVLGTVPKSGKAETTRAIDAAAEAFKSFSRTTAAERAKMLRQHARRHPGQRRCAGRAADARTGQVAGRSEGRDRHRRPPTFSGSPRKAAAPMAIVVPSPWADRRIMVTKEPVGVVARDHAVELPVVDACAQDRSGARRRLHRRSSSRPPRRPIRASPGACLPKRLAFPKGVDQHRHRFGGRDRRRDLRQPAGARRSPSPARPRSARS